jgi:AraC-like DNA-binding protein
VECAHDAPAIASDDRPRPPAICRAAPVPCESVFMPRQTVDAIGEGAAACGERWLVPPDGELVPLDTVVAALDAIEPLARMRVFAAVPFGAYGGFDYLVGSASTVGHAIAAVRDHLAAVDPVSSFEIVERPDGAAELAFPPTVPEALTDLGVANSVFRMAMTAGRRCPIDEIRIARDRPDDAADWVELLGAPVVFGAPSASVVLPAATLRMPNALADERLHRVLRESFAQWRDDTVALVSAVRATVVRRLPNGVPSIPAVAAALAVSPRTLQRRLREQGSTYDAIVDDARRHESLHRLVHTNEPLGDIARAVGFAEQASFTRAVRRWTGSTPSAVRSS